MVSKDFQTDNWGAVSHASHAERRASWKPHQGLKVGEAVVEFGAVCDQWGNPLAELPPLDDGDDPVAVVEAALARWGCSRGD